MSDDLSEKNNQNQNFNNLDSKTQEEVGEFVEALVLAITGFKLEEIPEEKREEIVSDCIELFTKFILEYVEVNYSKKDALRLKAGYETGEDVFTRFPDLKEKYETAYKAFIEMLEENLEQEKAEYEKQKEKEAASEENKEQAE